MESPQKFVVKLEYVGEPILTRGDFGEQIKFGHIDTNCEIWVWDSTYGYISLGCLGEHNITDWKLTL